MKIFTFYAKFMCGAIAFSGALEKGRAVLRCSGMGVNGINSGNLSEQKEEFEWRKRVSERFCLIC